ncbi:MAG: 4-hydroxy-3-methylbut-2-enyl diphosphate reductase [Burkholderiales bacterium]
MEILLAESFGFCMGVKRAVDLAYRALDQAGGLPVVTLGPLIHNRQETARLAADGIGCADLESLPTAGAVVIRAHGVGPRTYAELRRRGLRVLDATCPYVHYSQRRAVELQAAGYTVVIAGVREHPEIRGILGHLNDAAYVVQTPEEARALPACDRIGVIAQTTIAVPKYQAIIAALRERARELKVCETICDATAENQTAVRRLAAEVELLYIVGGRHSDNSNKLAETARECCPRALLIETEEEIRPEDLRGVTRVGVSAGASAPDWMIQRVITRLRALDRAGNAYNTTAAAAPVTGEESPKARA